MKLYNVYSTTSLDADAIYGIKTRYLLPIKCACKISPFPATARNDIANLFSSLTDFDKVP